LGLGYEFENIESQIGRGLALAKANDFDDEEANKILDLVSLECERVIKTFKQHVLSARDENYVRRYFHFHQESLTRLIDQTDIQENSAAVLAAKFKVLLIELLDKLKHLFPAFFNFNARMPRPLEDVAVSKLTESAGLLRAKFTTTAADPVLIDIILRSYNSHEPVSYYKINYLTHLEQRLSGLDTSINESNLLRQELCKALINCNYNSPDFFRYYTTTVEKALANCETMSDRIDLISWFLKECNQQQSLGEISFHPERPPIHVHLGEWLTQELDYYKQKQQLLLSPGLLKDGPEKDFKLNFDLSVSQLAYLFKALIDTSVIRNKNTSQLIRFLVKFVKTKKSESVSYESFRMKFYNPESGTKDAVKKVLGSLLQYMSKN
jgi:hypothetical protein